MAVRSVSLVMAATVGLVVLGAILAIALLISSERGRTMLKVLLIVPALALVVALLTLFSWRAGSFARHQAEAGRLARQHSHVQRAEVRQALAEASAHFDEAIARLDEPDPEVQRALAEASGRLHKTLGELDRPAAEARRAMVEAQARLQQHLSRIDRPSPEIEGAFAEISARIDAMRAKLEEQQGGRPVAHGDVNGTVACNGQPILYGTIKFVPIGGTAGPPSSSPIVDGGYHLREAVPGMHRVEITATELVGQKEPEPDEIGKRKQPLPAKYNTESILKVEVKSGKKNTFTFALSADLDEQTAAPESTDAVAMADKDEAESAEPPEKSQESVEQPAPFREVPAEGVAEEETAPAEDRPHWVDATPRKLGSVYQMKVDVGPYADQEELDRELPQALQKGVDEYVTTYLGPRARGKIRLPLDYIRGEVVDEEWKETVQVQITPEGQIPAEYVPTTRLHVLLQFDYPVNARIEEEWDKVVVTERLFGVGSVAGMVLMLLAGVYAYLKIDLATAGAYRGRLRLAAAAVLLIAILAGLALSAA